MSRGDRNDSSLARSLPVTVCVGVTGIGPAASRPPAERSADELHPDYTIKVCSSRFALNYTPKSTGILTFSHL